MPALTQANLLTFVKAFIAFGWLLIALIQSVGALLSAPLVAVVLVIAILVLRILNREDWLFIAAGVVLGVLIGLVPQLGAKGVMDTGLMFAVAVLVGLQT